MADQRIRVGYVRVSTGKTSQETSVDRQEFVLREQAKVDRVISESLSASGSRRRPGWEELRGMVAAGLVSEVVVSDLSRIARDGSDQLFLEECHLMGTRVVDTNGVEYENHTVAGLLTSGVLSLVNKAQSRITGAKVAEGNRRRREQGLYGRPNAPFGYAYQEGNFVEHPGEWIHARWLIEELLRRDCNVYGTLRHLPATFPRTYTRVGLRKWIYNPILRGGVGIGWDRAALCFAEIVWGQAPVLISPMEWDVIHRTMQLRHQTRGTKTGFSPHLFTGVVRCDECGRNLWWAAKPSRPTGRYVCGNMACGFLNRTVRESVLVAGLKRALAAQADDLAREASKGDRRASPPTQREMELRNSLEQLEGLQQTGTRNLGRAITGVRAELAALEREGPAIAMETYRRLFADPATFDNATPEELRALIVALVDRVDFHGRPNGITFVMRNGRVI
jgi:DNA invertase Pin-like site-specific DNA recombinase